MADADKEPKVAGENEEDDEPVVEEECVVEFQPVVQLEEQDVVTGEENEEAIFKMRAKLFRFDSQGQQWKERGTGDVRLMRHKETTKVRLLMRREKTLKICMNHYVNTDVKLQENVGSDRSWVWNAIDYAEGERDECVLAIRFKNTDEAQEFKEQYDKARAHMRKLAGLPEAEDESDDDDDEEDDENDKKETEGETKEEAK